jgi:hypothetical protein
MNPILAPPIMNKTLLIKHIPNSFTKINMERKINASRLVVDLSAVTMTMINRHDLNSKLL